MTLTPRGMSIQEAYRLYRDDSFIVNRKYQRKLVWTVEEKAFLIDSILQGLPIPLILLAQVENGKFEIIDGLQRLNAIFSFIENSFGSSGKYFDVKQFARANQVAEGGEFSILEGVEKLSPLECANILDYQLAVTTYTAQNDGTITNIFGRINGSGKQLSYQEMRQAGSTDDFSNIVREIASEIRGDSSADIVILKDMPIISIDSAREKIGYGLTADDIFWCKQGVLWKNHLRDSEDEEMIADIVASIIFNKPFERSRDRFDEMYDQNSDLHKESLIHLNSYGKERIKHEIKVTFSIIKEILESVNKPLNRILNPGNANPVKASFYTVFMAFHKLVVQQEKTPENYEGIIGAIEGLQTRITPAAHYTTEADRTKNINLTIGLIQAYFVNKEPTLLKHGAGLAIDFENSIRRSKVETDRYECKQGIITLNNGTRNIDSNIINNIVETICGMANIGPDSEGYIFIGVADNEEDYNRIKLLDSIEGKVINSRFVVGIDREFPHFGDKPDDYVNFILRGIQSSKLSEPLKTEMLSNSDIIDYHGLTVIRLKVPKQNSISFVDGKCYIRQSSRTIKIEDSSTVIQISKKFPS